MIFSKYGGTEIKHAGGTSSSRRATCSPWSVSSAHTTSERMPWAHPEGPRDQVTRHDVMNHPQTQRSGTPMAKELEFNDSAPKSLERGVDALANAVR